MNKEEYNDIIINDAVNILNDDGVVILPTDTVYGLAVKSNSEVAEKKIYNIKKRDLNKKLPVIVDTYERLLSICDVNLDDVRKFYPYIHIHIYEERKYILLYHGISAIFCTPFCEQIKSSQSCQAIVNVSIVILSYISLASGFSSCRRTNLKSLHLEISCALTPDKAL